MGTDIASGRTGRGHETETTEITVHGTVVLPTCATYADGRNTSKHGPDKRTESPELIPTLSVILVDNVKLKHPQVQVTVNGTVVAAPCAVVAIA